MDPSFWSTPLSPESTVEEALTAMFNDTRRNPNPRPRMRYSPRTFTYNTSCNESTAAITVDGKTSVFFPPTNIKCKMYGFAIVPIGYYWDPTAAIQKQIDSSTFMMVAPANKLNSSEVDYAIEPFLFAFRAKHQCAAKVSDINIGVILPESPKDGVVILPKTLSTRCHYGPEDDSLILSTTYLQFALNPTIAADLNYRGPEPPSYYNASNHIDVIIRHLPRNLEQDDSQEPSPPFSSAQLIKATAGAAKYLASLGHNVYIYKDSESNADQLYILYDAIEIKDAYEIPNAVLATVIALTVLFGLVWYISERFQVVYNSTLYKTIYKELNTRDETVPMLLRYTGNPLAFDGNQVISKSDDLQNIAPETQDHPMVSMERQDNQSLASLDQTSIHYPITNSVSSTTSTPIMSLATPTPNSTTASTTWPSHGTQLQPPRNSSPGLLPRISRGDLDLQMELYPHPRSLNDTHDGDQASFPSTHQ
ncbi:hypothetical protein BGW42_001541 [Actinomortierella wolfii]|nr:hypothetical protein BGW42_001541 [Actinomortierella wolfii]